MGAAAAGGSGETPTKGGESELNHRTHQDSTPQQRISNFLYPTETVGPEPLPERFLEFCRHSVDSIRGNSIYTDPMLTPYGAASEFDGAEGGFLELKDVQAARVIPLDPITSPRPVVAVDTSTIKLGELEDGCLCGLRGAAVLLESNCYRYVRYGPLVFSLGSRSLADFSSLGLTPFTGELNVDSLLKRIRNLVERWLQFSVSSSARNAVLLIDGSLTAGTPDNPCRQVEQILETARRVGNVVIGISKKTKLRLGGQSITNLLDGHSEPCLWDVDEQITEQFPAYPVRFLGRVFVGKLAKVGFPFRVDIDREVSMDESVNALRHLTGTDIVDQGYPETLRIAHILSTFTANEVLGMQVYAAANFGAEMIPRFALRRSLFGPFGTGWESW